MAVSTRLVDLIQDSIDVFVNERRHELQSIAPELTEVLDLAQQFLAGGKRFRGLFCYWGWQSVRPKHADHDTHDAQAALELPGIVRAAAALEVFHAAALIHDDIMDKSDTRRGALSAHRRFEAMHAGSSWTGNAADFGTSAALLLGDLLLGWSDELFDQATAALPTGDHGRAGRKEFSTMRTEVTAGQYLDILEENAWATYPETDALSRAHRVIVYKSAKYSVEAPLVIGGALGGADENQIAALRAFGLPLGVAYQLRDDLLGVFGDPDVTGKPAGDDLREGKRTVLIALTRSKLASGIRTMVDELIGDPNLDGEQIAMLRSAIVDSGAVDEVEQIISHNVALAHAAIAQAAITSAARTQLIQLTDTVTRRTA